MKLILFMAFLIGLSFTEAEVQTSEAEGYNHYRLPASIHPISYKLRIVTHLENPENLTFAGDVQIHMKIVQATRNITLHAKNLTIDASRILLKNVHADGRPNCIESTEVNRELDYYFMKLCQPMNAGDEFILSMPFANELNRGLSGYYRSSYLDKKLNQTRWLATTQFEPADARAAFPCFDEPEYKAKFSVIMGHHKQYTALSNMPLKETKPMLGHPDWVWSEFEESVPMSTYLVAFGVNDFAHKQSETSLRHKVQFRTWAHRDVIDQCDFASEVGPKALQYYEDIFNIKFPFEKIDQIAIPDLNAYGVENWGLVTYQQAAILYAKNVSSASKKFGSAALICHELAHQWFGNLVTMKWWSDLWLNEGFATYFATLCLENLYPEWQPVDREWIATTLYTFKEDALKSSHPISRPVYEVNTSLFDLISYKKGSTVLRMMHTFLGDEAFRNGIKEYLKAHAYNNVEQDDLWSALTDSAHKYRSIPEGYDIKRIMDSWTLQTGYPIITVTRDYDQKTAQITQMRYLLDTEASRSEGHNCWWVPLSYTSKSEVDFNGTKPKDWLQCDKSNGMVTKVLKDMPNGDEWVIFNLQMATPYKVKYDQRNWDMLIETLMSDEYEKIHVLNRAQLIDDALTLAWTGDQDYDVALRLIDYLTREREYIPWVVALDNLDNINKILKGTPEYELFKKYVRKIITPIYVHLHGLKATDTEAENPTFVSFKELITRWACDFDIEDCTSRAQDYFRQWRNSRHSGTGNSIPSDLRSVVYRTAIRLGSENDWDFLSDRLTNSNVDSEKSTIISALGCSHDVSILKRYLNFILDGSKILREQDYPLVFDSVVHNRVGYQVVKDELLNFTSSEIFNSDNSTLGILIPLLASEMSTAHDYETISAFVEDNSEYLVDAKNDVRQALEKLKVNVQWMEHKYNEFTTLIRQRLTL